MAKLDDVAKSLNVEMPVISTEKASGHKRRAWLEHNDVSTAPSLDNTKPGFDQLPSENKLETNLGQTEDKLETNLRQTEDKLRTNLGQTEDKPRTNLGQTEDKLETQLRTNLGQTEDKLRTKFGTKKNLIYELGKNKDNLRANKFFAKLSGLKQKILLFIYDECQAIADVETPPLRIEYISSSCKSTTFSIRKTIQRLEFNGLLIRSDYQPGRSGWSQYKLPDEVYQEIHHLKSTNKLRTNLGQTEDKLETQLRTNLSSSSSSLKDLKTTTTRELSDEWNFDITSYARHGFMPTHLKQLSSLGALSAANVEQSLIEFSYDFENNVLPPIKTTKINFLMGLLRSGHSYVSEGFKNEQDATILEMARRSKAKQETLLNAKFEAWIDTLDDDQKKKVEEKMPTHLMVVYRAHSISNPDLRTWLFDYFLQNALT